jgi:hypothetical protein
LFIFSCFLLPLLFEMCDSEKHAMDWGHCWEHMGILRRWLLGVYFQPFQMHKMKMNWKVGHEVEGWNVNFHKWKGIWIYKRCLNWFPFQKRKDQGKYDCGEKQRWKSWKKLGGWWSITPHCSKRRNGAWVYRKWKKNSNLNLW